MAEWGTAEYIDALIPEDRPTDPPTLTIRAVRCPALCDDGRIFGQFPDGDGGSVKGPAFAHCPTCHARGPEPGWVWDERDVGRVEDWSGSIDGAATLNALYAAQSRIG